MSQRLPGPCQAVACLVLSISLLLFTACGAGPAFDEGTSAAEQERVTSERVVLTVLPDTYVAGGRAEAIEVTERQGEGALLIDISVRGAVNLKALYFHLEYDPALYGAGQLNSRFLLAPEEECLSLYLGDPASGVLEYGELIMLPQEPRPDGTEKGFSGEGLLCTLQLKERGGQVRQNPAR